MTTPRSALKPGDVLGRYQLLVPIGQGGMGRVWVAREQHSGTRQRLVAIKTALTESVATEDFWKVLLDEARIASQVQHPNVCAIHELEKERGVVYVVMDWSDAGSLRELLDALPDHRLEPTIAARIVAEVCAGLHAAHEIVGEDGASLGVVHRDVSPQNILLSSTGHVKITDFGVAKARGQLHAPTQTGEVKGKLSYMAPEQVTSKDADRRADVFALGCVLYEATIGQRPFHGDDALATLYQLLEQPLEPPSRKLENYSPELEAIVLKALERRPDDRYQTTEEMGRALQAWIAAERAIVTEANVAAVVRDGLGPRIEKRIKQIEQAGTALDAGALTFELTPEAGQTLSGAAASTLPNFKQNAARKRGVGVIAIASVIAVAGIGIAAATRTAPPPQPPTRSSQPSAGPTLATKSVTPATVPSVVVTLRAEPASAALYLDDGPALPNPYQLTLTPELRTHQLRVSARGFVDTTRELTFDHSQELTVALERETPNLRRRPLATQSPAVVETPTSTPPPVVERRPGELPPVIRKPPRTLDEDNPFAKRP